jgi:hypothetical protein
MNIIPIDRKIKHNDLMQCLAACKHFVDQGGRNIIFYPEGTRSLTGEIQTVKNGPALFATELQLPIVPARENIHETEKDLCDNWRADISRTIRESKWRPIKKANL